MKRFILLLALASLSVAMVGCGGDDGGAEAESGQGGRATLLNVSYDPTREFYAEYNEIFREHYLETTGTDVTVEQSHGGSGSQARAIVDGLEADVATLALSADTERLVEGGLTESGWQAEFPQNSSPYTSTIVLLVRAGNPKNIQDWDDLARDDVSVITPNPKTSGGARWNFMAIWGFVTENGGSEDDAKELTRAIFGNVEVLDTGARGSTQTFAERGIGDVLIAWENEALLTLRDAPGDFEIIVPSISILAEPAVAIVDQNVDDRGTREIATEYLSYLYDPEIQRLAAKHFYRPSNAEVLAEVKDQYPELELVQIDDFGGWGEVQQQFFADGGIFDEIYP